MSSDGEKLILENIWYKNWSQSWWSSKDLVTYNHSHIWNADTQTGLSVGEKVIESLHFWEDVQYILQLSISFCISNKAFILIFVCCCFTCFQQERKWRAHLQGYQPDRRIWEKTPRTPWRIQGFARQSTYVGCTGYHQDKYFSWKIYVNQQLFS